VMMLIARSPFRVAGGIAPAKPERGDSETGFKESSS